jgi:hypothetical protein
MCHPPSLKCLGKHEITSVFWKDFVRKGKFVVARIRCYCSFIVNLLHFSVRILTCRFLYLVVYVHTDGSICTVNSCLGLEKDVANGSHCAADLEKMVFTKENWFQKKTPFSKAKFMLSNRFFIQSIYEIWNSSYAAALIFVSLAMWELGKHGQYSG